MSKNDKTYERITRYLKDLLTGRERHDLEKEMMRDVFDEEAFDGISSLSHADFEADMSALTNRLNERIRKKKKNLFLPVYRIAAGVVLLAGIGTILYILLKPPEPEFISQDLKKTAPAPETVIPAVPKTMDKRKDMPADGSDKTREDESSSPVSEGLHLQRAETDVAEDEPLEEIAPAAGVAHKEIREAESARAPERSYKKEEQADTSYENNYITGRVLGVNRQALAGVSIMEKGATRGTLTDVNGNFRIEVRDPGARLTMNYLGYEPLEVPSEDVSGREIMLAEDPALLKEMVVLAYGSKSRNRSARSSDDKSRDTLKAVSAAPYKYNNPVPPGGSVKSFKEWVEANINTELFMDMLPGRYRIQVSLRVLASGSLSEISVKNDVPLIVSEEYKRVVAQSLPWQPALQGKTPIDAELVISFHLTIE